MTFSCMKHNILLQFLLILSFLTHIGRVEGYCNLVLCVCVCEQSFWTTNSLVTSIKLQTSIKIKDRLFLKLFVYKVMTIITTHNCHFTTFRRLLIAKEYMETQIILFECLPLLNHSLKSSTVEVVGATTSSWL